MAGPQPDLWQVAEVVGAHGIRGAFKIRCLTEDRGTVPALNPMLDRDGARLFDIDCVGHYAGGLIVKAIEVATRNQAEALVGAGLFVPRERLGAPDEEEYFAEDLIGLIARSEGGGTIGRVKAVFDFGAGDILEIEREGATSLLVPFAKAFVPFIDLESKAITVTATDALEP